VAKVDDVVRNVLAAAATDANAVLAAAWVNQRYKEMTSRYKFRHLYESADIDVSGGGISFDTGATDIQFYARVRYFDGTNYIRDIKRVLVEDLDIWNPTRTATVGSSSTTGPYVYADIGLNTDADSRQIEIYPAPQKETNEKLVFNYYEAPVDLTISSTLPYGITVHDLREGALVDLYRYEQARSIRAGDIEIASAWAEAIEKQLALWEMAMQRAYDMDNGSFDDSR
jgi:hypothetical protein